MSEIKQVKMKKHFRFRNRENNEITLRKFIPNFVTLLALCVGLTSIKFGLEHNWEYAVFCLIFSAILDATDGRLARYLGSTTHFGAELDSLADFVNFGVSPAIVGYMLSIQKFGDFGWGVCLFFIICSGLRLARFNTSKFYSHEDDAPWQHNYSVGVAAPAGAIFAVVPIIFYLATGCDFLLAPCFLVTTFLMSGILMISRIKTFVFKNIKIKPSFVPLSILMACLFVICIVTKVWYTMSAICIIYLISIPCSHICYRNKLISEKKKKELAQDQPKIEIIQ